MKTLYSYEFIGDVGNWDTSALKFEPISVIPTRKRSLSTFTYTVRTQTMFIYLMSKVTTPRGEYLNKTQVVSNVIFLFKMLDLQKVKPPLQYKHSSKHCVHRKSHSQPTLITTLLVFYHLCCFPFHSKAALLHDLLC